MARMGRVYCGGRLAGRISEVPEGYEFAYDAAYLADSEAPAVSLTLPKQSTPHSARVLFPFFYGLLAEGVLKTTQCRNLRVDEDDHFGRLLKTAHADTIGDVTVVEESES